MAVFAAMTIKRVKLAGGRGPMKARKMSIATGVKSLFLKEVTTTSVMAAQAAMWIHI